MKKKELQRILEEHKNWLNGNTGRRTNLSYANLSYTDLSYANLSYANLEFYQFPSIRLLSSIRLGRLSDKLTIEIMNWNAANHPNPERFNEWANGGVSPYQNEEELFHHEPIKELWKKKKRMSYPKLAIAICKEKGWGIKGYLKPKERRRV